MTDVGLLLFPKNNREKKRQFAALNNFIAHLCIDFCIYKVH